MRLVVVVLAIAFLNGCAAKQGEWRELFNGRDLSGWCSVVGHRQMGMVFAVEVTGPAEQTGHEHASAGAAHDHDANQVLPLVIEHVSSPRRSTGDVVGGRSRREVSLGGGPARAGVRFWPDATR